MARAAETSSIERHSKIKVSASIQVYGKNTALANFQPVTGKRRKTEPPK